MLVVFQIQLNSMEAAQLKDQIQTQVENLSRDRLKVVLDFLSYLNAKEEDEATQELLAIPNFERELTEAEKEMETEELVDWRTIRDDI